jgi:hypothetical protein
MDKKVLFLLLFAFLNMAGQAQTEEHGGFWNVDEWTANGVLVMVAPDYPDDNTRYEPQSPFIFYGPSRLSDGIFGGKYSGFHLRDKPWKNANFGVTLLQFSRNIYHRKAGVTAALQFGGESYEISRDYALQKEGNRLGFVPVEEPLSVSDLSFSWVRIPLLVGVQTFHRRLTLQTGPALYAAFYCKYYYKMKGREEEKRRLHINHFGVQWHVTAGIGPIVVTYSQYLTPLFKLADGTRAYPSSITIGFDVWHLLTQIHDWKNKHKH